MIAWVEIAKRCSKLRYEALSEFMNQNGVENKVEFLETDEFNFSTQLEEVQSKYDQIRLGGPFNVKVTKDIKAYPSEILTLGSADTFLKDLKLKQWWLKSLLVQSFQRHIALHGEHMNWDGGVLIVGSGSAARCAVSAFVQAGFKRISFSTQNTEQGLEFTEAIKRFYFDVEFDFIPKEKLVMLPGSYNALVNTTPMVEENELLEELYFFNFIRKPGLLIDLTMLKEDVHLISEAKEIGVHTVDGYQMASFADLAWVKMISKKELDNAAYEKFLRDKYKQD